MEKTKKLVTMTKTHEEMLDTIMKQDGLSNRSVAIGNLILQEANRRSILGIPLTNENTIQAPTEIHR
jgi:hypothetical protein